MTILQGLALLVGLGVGSFINVVVSRVPKKEDIFFGRSRCPYCRTKLYWYELIPILSFLWLKGRCRTCGQKISWQYPIIEAITGGGFFLGTFLLYGNFALLVWFLALFSFLILIAAYDARYLVIPDWAVVSLLVWAALGKLWFERDTIVMSALAGGVLALFFLLLFIISRGRWLGGGDVKLAAGLGFWVGWPEILVLFGVAYIAGGLVAALLLVLGRAQPKQKIAFGPLLILGALTAFLWGNEIIQWYLKDLPR